MSRTLRDGGDSSFQHPCAFGPGTRAQDSKLKLSVSSILKIFRTLFKM